jgi:hypothetical protein
VSARLPTLLLSILALAACGPKLPAGVDEARLTDEIGRAIGDPSTCVIVSDAKGKTVYQFGTHTTCGRALPACDAPGARTVEALSEQAAAGRDFSPISCRSLTPDRGVAWAAGPIEGRPLYYAAVMEGSNIPPGLVIRDKLAAAFRRAGL